MEIKNTNKKIIFVVVGIMILGGMFFTMQSIQTSAKKDVQNENISKTEQGVQKAEKIEVFVFHATQRCISCITIGKFAGETVNEFFQPELRDARIEFREINVDLPENKELATKFQASGSALFINTIIDGQDHIAEDTKVWRLVQNEAQFKAYLKSVLDEKFGK